MLVELTIRNFAIIDQLSLEFHPGFNVLTGETGAGKSIIIDAVELLLGGRADSSVVRAGADRALVEGLFRLEPELQPLIASRLEAHGLEGDAPDLLLLSREVRRGGRSISRVNGRAVSLALLREVSEGLVDIHGQSEHLSLLRVRRHVGLLDRYAGLDPLREELAQAVGRLRRVRRELAELMRDERELARRMDLLQFQIQEIEAAHLEPGEEEALVEERNRLANAEQLAALATEAYAALQEGDLETPTAADLIGSALQAVTRLVRLDPSMAPLQAQLETLSYHLDDVAHALADYRDQIEFNPRRLVEVEERLEVIRRLQRKYGETIEEVLAYARQAAAELERITTSEERVEILQAEEAALLSEIGRLAAHLSARRQEAAARLAAAVEAELADLRMAGARFAVAFRWKPDPQGCPVEGVAEGGLTPSPAWSEVRVTATGVEEEPAASDAGSGDRLAFDATGVDRVEFLIAPNVGEPFKPLVRIASGGETSRLMLALKTVLARADAVPTLVFDEIDQGIGGRVGAIVGQKLWQLTLPSAQGTAGHQVLCVTHLPQLAGFGDRHLKVEKVVREGRTVTQVT
ncbi:MAG TPA: DNA repair protein RecN, partial [Chloroflexi bacterium]|nr:DNA repair protein RecN [Chloroflexota bacterium]